MRFPDFYIVGAPKCGTTSLFTYLGRHPGVFFPSFKEPNFFLMDLPNVRHYPTEARYLSLYAHAPEDAMCGDASVWNLFSSAAAEEIHRHRPDAKIIVMLRNPVDAALSLHNHSIAMLLEDVDDFVDAWRAQDARRRGDNLPFYCPHRELIIYRDVYLYARQVKRYFDVFGRDQVRVILFDDFVAETRRIYEETVDFLGLAPELHRCEFEPVNEALTLKSRFVMDFLRAPPRAFQPLILAGKRAANAVGVKPAGILLKHFAKPVARPTLSPDHRAEVYAAFEDDIAALEQVIGRNLDCWRDLPAVSMPLRATG